MPAPADSRVVALRTVTEDDRAFLLSVYASTRDEELAQVAWAPGQLEAFLELQFGAQDRDYRGNHPAGAFDVIEVDGQAVGRLYVDRGADELRLVDIALLPAYRSLGVGERLIRSLQAEAAATGRVVVLHVEATNRAAHLYERLGFVVVDERGVHRRMEWRA